MSLLNDASLILVPSAIKTGEVLVQKPLPNKFADETGNYDGNDPQGSANLTFTRASTATRVNSSGLIETVASNVPRLDYLGSSCPRLLLEPQRLNNALYNQDLSNAWWNKSSCSVASTAGGPLAGGNYWTVTCNATTGVMKGLSVSWVNLSSGTYTLSVLAKAGTASSFSISSRANLSGTNFQARYNLSNGEVSAVFQGTAKTTPYGDGWYLCEYTFSQPGGYNDSASIFFGHSFNAADNSTVLIAAPQSEAGSYATSRILTTTTSVTRLADAASKTGISSLIGQTEGTIYLDFELQTTGQDMVIMNIYNETTPFNSIYFYLNTSNVLLAYVDNSGTQANPSSGVLTQGRYKAALAYKANDFAFYINGSLVGSDVSGSVPTCGAIRMENYNAAPTYQEKTAIKQALLFKTRLSNAKLAELTTL